LSFVSPMANKIGEIAVEEISTAAHDIVKSYSDLSAVTTSDVQKKLKEKFSLKDDVVAAHQKQLEEIISKAITAAKEKHKPAEEGSAQDEKKSEEEENESKKRKRDEESDDSEAAESKPSKKKLTPEKKKAPGKKKADDEEDVGGDDEESEEQSPSASWSGSEGEEGSRKKKKGAATRKQPPPKKTRVEEPTTPEEKEKQKQIEKLQDILKAAGIRVTGIQGTRDEQLKKLKNKLKEHNLREDMTKQELKAYRKKKEQEKELDGLDPSAIIDPNRRVTRARSGRLPPKSYSFKEYDKAFEGIEGISASDEDAGEDDGGEDDGGHEGVEVAESGEGEDEE
jgi:DNA polymerase III alpha subunit (gram-positive type)